jgi:hypothetical protein
MGAAPVAWTRIWSSLGDALSLVLLTRALDRGFGRASAWAFAAFFSSWTYFAAVTISGMENNVLVALVALGATLAGRRSRATGPVLAALALVRPEGVMAALIIALVAAWRDRIVGAALFAACLGLLAIQFGSLLPQSMLAKAALYGTPGPVAGRFWWEWMLPGPLGRWPAIAEGSALVPLMPLIGPAFVLGVRAMWRRRSRSLAAAAAALLAILAGYSALGVAYFSWYFAPTLVGVMLVACIGLPAIVRGRALWVSLAAFLVLTWTVAPKLYRGRAETESEAFAATANLVARVVQPGQKVMVEPIGMIGWRVPAVIIDESGLVSPQVLRRRLQGAGWYADVVGAERPDVLVVRAGLRWSNVAYGGNASPFRSSAERGRVFAGYDEVSPPAGAAMSGTSLLVYRRRH